MIQLAVGVGSAIFLVLGGLHGVLIIRDLFEPRTFTPTDDSVREAMSGVPLALHPSTDLWKAWLGFNLSHSLGLVVFGGGLLTVAVFNFDLFVGNIALRFVAVVIAAIYFLLSVRFWFSGPAIASGIGTALFLAAAILA